jgi:membrane-associated phospholipid phosphatase
VSFTASRPHRRASKPRTIPAIVLLVLAGIQGTLPLAIAAEERDHSGDRSAPLLESEPFPFLAPQDDSLERPYWRRNLFGRLAGDQRVLATRWWGGEFRRLGFALPLALGMMLAGSSNGEKPGLDERIGQSWRRSLGGPDNRLARGFSRLGDAESAIALVGGTYFLSRWAGNERLSRSSSLAAEALLNAGLWNVALKKLTRRTRPVAGGHGEFLEDHPLQGQSTDSFPSGHSMGAFAVATVLADEYRDRRWVPWAAYATAGLIGGSRLSLDRHFPSDVIVGALLGHSIGKMVTARQQGHGDEPTGRIEPVFTPGGEGFGITYVRTW